MGGRRGRSAGGGEKQQQQQGLFWPQGSATEAAEKGSGGQEVCCHAPWASAEMTQLWIRLNFMAWTAVR